MNDGQRFAGSRTPEMSESSELPIAAVLAVAERAFGTMGDSLTAERVAAGTSTPVYRLSRGDDTAYLRVGEHAGHRLDVEVVAHERLRAIGVQVPEVLAFEPYDERLGRAAMVVAALPGSSAADGARHGELGPGDVDRVYRAAGRDLARIASLSVDGFGFVVRDANAWPPRARHATAADALLDGWQPADVAALLGPAATPAVVATLEDVAGWAAVEFRGAAVARLAHGDVDPAHVFHLDGGYTGLIDLGELRGAPPRDDLARFRLWCGDGPELAALTAGYGDIAPLPTDHVQRCRRLAALQGVHHLARWRQRDGTAMFAKPVARRLARRVVTQLGASTEITP